MKTLGVFLLAFVCANAIPTNHLLGSKQCTWGPSYWCSNLTAAAGCHAVKHCIQTVWEHKVYPTDGDSVCQTCKTMVKQARDQLESNETQEEIKEVFEGSCKLIPIKVINQECCKLADDFIPELIDTLASQMNPDVVCSVAGLCNNARIDKLLAEQANEVVTKHPTEKPDTCTGCHTVVDILEKRFKAMTRDEYLNSLLQVCGGLGSFSDACSDVILTYFSNIYSQMSTEFNSNNICLLSGECSTNFHVHKVEITPMSAVGIVQVGDDLPCELCEQLVGHLRDLLIADTTEAEFQKVLEGLCKQTQGFQKQCLSIVDEYYPVIYNFLVNELNSTEVCKMISICPASDEQVKALPIIPLLPEKSALLAKVKNPTLARVGLTKDDSLIKVIAQKQFESQSPDLMQLPIERLNDPSRNKIYSKELCTFCEYFLHYAQLAITDPKTEENIKNVIDRACTKLPNSVNETCIAFVNTYSDALVALLAQEIDPSVICPLIQVCPRENVQDIEIFMQGPSGDKPNCPLCLLAVTKLEEMVKDGRTKTNIKNALNSLCSHLSGNVKDECQDFVNAYTDELVEMLINDFKPQEVCVYLKICNDNKPAPSIADMSFGGVISTNEIPDFTANGKFINPKHNVNNKPQCVLCEFVIEKLDEILKDKKDEEEIKNAIHGICNHLPKTINTECNNFVTKYADTILDLIVSEAEPDQICAMMSMCVPKLGQEVTNIKSPQCTICKLVMNQIESLIGGNVTESDVKRALETVCSLLPRQQEDDCDKFVEKNGKRIYELLLLATQPGEICSLLFLCDDQHPEDIKWHIHKCAVCEATVLAMRTILENPKVDHNIEHVLEKSCRALPPKDQPTCKTLIDEYGFSMFTLLDHLSDSNIVCKELDVCEASVRPKREQLLGANKCSRGPGYWCESEENAKSCGEGAQIHCMDKVWKNDRPKREQQLVGSNNCTWGPSHWCASEENARACGEGAHEHCTMKVWKGSPPQ